MAKRKSLIVGHQVVVAGKARKCRHNNKHSIQKGELLIEVRDGMAWRGYCRDCAYSMIVIGRENLSSIENALREI